MLALLITVTEFLPTSGHSCIIPKKLQFWYFPWGMLQNTHKAFTFMVMLQQMQQSEEPKVQSWTWVPNSQAHKNSIISRCREHTLTTFPGICLSDYCIKQIQRVTSQASSHTLPCWLETQEWKRKFSQTEKARKAPNYYMWVAWHEKCCLENWSESSVYNAKLFVSFRKQPCRKAAVWFQMSKDGKIPKSICFR